MIENGKFLITRKSRRSFWKERGLFVSRSESWKERKKKEKMVEWRRIVLNETRGRSVAIVAVNTADTARGEFCQINNPPKARAQLASVVVLLARDVTSSKTLLLPGPVHPPPPH